MDLDNVIQIFTILGSFVGIGAFYLAYKQYKKNQPELECYVEKANYKILENSEFNIRIVADFIVNNTGGASTSITAGFGYIRLHPEAEKYGTAVIDAQAKELKKNEEKLPIIIKSYSSKKMRFSFNFKADYPELLDRCGVTIDLKNPKKWEWIDLPILSKFVFHHTQGKINTKSCIFRSDLPDSKEKRSKFAFDNWEDRQEFYPKPKK